LYPICFIVAAIALLLILPFYLLYRREKRKGIESDPYEKMGIEMIMWLLFLTTLFYVVMGIVF